MIKFNKIKQLFPRDKYLCGVLSQKDTYQLGQVGLKCYYHTVGTLLFLPETKKLWEAIKNSLIVLQYNTLAYDYNIKPETEKILRPHFKDILLITLDFKTAAIKAGLVSRGYNSLVWSPRFGFDCKITAWGFFEEVIGYQKPRLPEWLPYCKNCLACHHNCPSNAFSGKLIEDFEFDTDKCESIIGKQVNDFAVQNKSNLSMRGWYGVPGGIPNHCRVCQDQLPCKVAIHNKIK